MQRLWMHIAVAVLLAGGALLGGASLVDAHGKPVSCEEWRHQHSNGSQGPGYCAYGCSIVGHAHWVLRDNGICECCDDCD